MKKLPTLITLLLVSGCTIIPWSPWPTYDAENRKINGHGSLVEMAKAERVNLERAFSVKYDTELTIFWSDFGSQYEYKFNTIRISRTVDRTPAMREHVRHELTEAFVRQEIGLVTEGQEPTHLNDVLIKNVIPSWHR